VSPQHPVRLVVTDDLQRSRLTVLFRVVLAIPHVIWALVWTIAALAAVIVSWFATLFAGRSPAALHSFLASYVRYITHLSAYLGLAANPYPGFTGSDAYPIDIEIDGPAPQRRLVTLFRIVLGVPALAFAATFFGMFPGGSWSSDGDTGRAQGASTNSGIVWTVAFLAWFAILAIKRMPHGFRNLQAYGLRYGAQALAYFFLLTDRYPNLDPADPPSSGPPHPVGITVTDDLRRSRVTVLFRLLLALPHLVWLVLWGIAAFFALIASWFATLVRVDEEDDRYGRAPQALHRFLATYLRYSLHVEAFLSLAANPFPGFTGTPGSYPVDAELPEPERQNRVVTLFRLPLSFPAFAVSGALFGLAFFAALFGWFVALALGRLPQSLRDAQAYVIRYGLQTSAYLFLLTERYPFSGPTIGEPEPPAENVEGAVAA
jgi:Domain of unknown function (DUF4389)